ncbi:MAG: acyl-CoA dehydrogenase family protein [Planctomycetes bacterium]|nr:acyl-CoA dehydrogenase family protein [Planctomycetota bacterium]
MDFRLTEEQELLRKSVAQFVAREVLPRAAAIDESGEFPADLFRRLGALGYFGARYPPELGGTGAGHLAFNLLVEELARGSLSLAAAAAMQSLMGTHFLAALGTPDHKTRLLAPALAGEAIGSIAMTEPGAGSDLGAMKTVAVRDGDSWRLSGRKVWVTNAPVADFFTVAAKTDPAAGFQGIDLFLVERKTPGLSVGREIAKLGTRGCPASELLLEDVRVPRENLLGGPGSGHRHLGALLSEIRVMTASLALGVGRAALDAALAYSGERVQFGKPIREFQAVAHRLADAATELEAARGLAYRAAWSLDQGKPDAKLAAMAKLFASEMANRAADAATRVLGSYGFAMEFGAQRHFRDARFLLYGGGTSEILRNVIARELSREA